MIARIEWILFQTVCMILHDRFIPNYLHQMVCLFSFLLHAWYNVRISEFVLFLTVCMILYYHFVSNYLHQIARPFCVQLLVSTADITLHYSKFQLHIMRVAWCGMYELSLICFQLFALSFCFQLFAWFYMINSFNCWHQIAWLHDCIACLHDCF